MTELEFDVLDELYFIASFEMLLKSTSLEVEQLKNILNNLFQKGYIKILKSDIETEPSEEEFLNYFQTYEYIASKKGLLAHNSI